MTVCLYAHVGNLASEEEKSCESIRRGKSCENPTIFGAVGPCGKNPVKNQPGAIGPKLWNDVGHVASEVGESCEKKTQILGAVGPKMWKD